MARIIDTTKQSKQAESLVARFADRIVGQPDATSALVSLVEKYQSGIFDPTKPIGSILFLGPTGTGKTACVEAFAEGLFNDPKALMKVDCAEFQHSHEIAKLQGSPPGYLGHRETSPFFTNARIKAHQTEALPFSIILFDEIEKASDALWNLLLGILDKGLMTCGDNTTVDFKSCFIVMTSNVGSKELAEKAGDSGLGFSYEKKVSPKELREIALSAARQKFMPEFLNRLDDVVMFNTLTQEDIRQILDIEIKLVGKRCLHGRVPFFLEISPSAKRQILTEGYDRKYNARNLKRVLEHKVSNPVSRAISADQIKVGDNVIVDYVDGEWKVWSNAVEENLQKLLQKGQLAVQELPKPTGSSSASSGL